MENNKKAQSEAQQKYSEALKYKTQALKEWNESQIMFSILRQSIDEVEEILKSKVTNKLNTLNAKSENLIKIIDHLEKNAGCEDIETSKILHYLEKLTFNEESQCINIENICNYILTKYAT